MQGHVVAAALLCLCGLPVMMGHEHGSVCKGDECSDKPNTVCKYSSASPEKYLCICKDGFAKNLNDECQSQSTCYCDTDKFYQCLLLPSNDTKCVCVDGYGYSKKKCSYKAPQSCENNDCPPDSTCYNYAYYEGYCCRCNKGFKPKDSSDPKSECVEDDSEGGGDGNGGDGDGSGEGGNGGDSGEGGNGGGDEHEDCPAGYKTEELLDGSHTCVLKDCSETAHGCCQDGTSAADGPDFDGCKETTNNAKKALIQVRKNAEFKTDETKKYLKEIGKIDKDEKKKLKKFGDDYLKMKDCCSKENAYDCKLLTGFLGCSYRYVDGEGVVLCCPLKAQKVNFGCDCLKCVAEVPSTPNVPWWQEKCFTYGICRPTDYQVAKVPYYCIRKDAKPLSLFLRDLYISLPGKCGCMPLLTHTCNHHH